MSAYKSLEDTRLLAVLTAHRAIVQLSEQVDLDESGARTLKVLSDIVNGVEELEIKQWLARAKSRPPAPDPDRARRIATGEEDPK